MNRDAVARAIEGRKKHIGIPWAEIARRAGVDVTTLSALRKQQNDPRPATLEDLSRALLWPPTALAEYAARGEGPAIDAPLADDTLERRVESLEHSLSSLRDELGQLTSGIREIRRMLTDEQTRT